MLHTYPLFNEPLDSIKPSKVLINTLNAHSFNTILKDAAFKTAIKNSDVLLPDGVGVVWATKILTGQKIKKIAGDDLFHYQMNKLNNSGGKCFFLGSTDNTLKKITERAAIDYPNVQVFNYSPPYRSEFSDEETLAMVEQVNEKAPDVLFVGMTAPKQEKWAYQNFEQLNAGNICCIGAVFDFYAGTSKRAPKWMIKIGLEWLYRLISNPKRMWRRYLIGNAKFIATVFKEKFFLIQNQN
ncbi:MAG: WecB/TagA/CpsF family glycosyltransferase [Dysgonamonadaceae bacterium]|nr:WecB/TagA/CpsF family glycosyltransferase [Dysgonamonadaceae bacterium]